MKELTKTLKREVERWAEHRYVEARFFKAMEENFFHHLHASLHLYNVEILIQNSLRCIQMAEISSKRLGYAKLAEFFNQKYREETGHDDWAKTDYMKMMSESEDYSFLKLLPGAIHLIEKLHHVSRFHPISMLAYIFFGEYHILLVGPKVSQMQQKTKGIETTLLDRHIELDIGHVEHDLQTLDDLIVEGEIGQRALRDMKDFMGFQIELLNGIFEAVPDHVKGAMGYESFGSDLSRALSPSS
ncbi:MAG: hypothetical protein OXB88_06410 [Bacteriovoracales bacterium]|nr:hypothetical protein [Bacteriovoracales bacterium]